uniref:Retrotransposon gag domain-containing protein n=1 Tax=Sinocyclocheilus anshuiensis TaxID=1608454 RepID=A0A671NM60_9TELE
MNPADRLVRLRQGNRSIEDYVEDFCGLCHQVDFNETFLKDIFRYGLGQNLSCLMPRNTPQWTLEKYIDFALQLSGSVFTVGVMEKEHDTSQKFAHVMPAKPQPAHVMPATPKPAHVMPATPGPAQTMPVKSKFTHVISTKSEPVQFMSAKPESGNIMSAPPGPARVTSAKPEPAPVMSATPSPLQVTSAKPELAHVMPAHQENLYNMAATPDHGEEACQEEFCPQDWDAGWH